MTRKPPSPFPNNFRRGYASVSWGLSLLGLGFVALVTIHAVSVLLFSVLGLAISSPSWPFVPTLAGFLSIATGAVALQSLSYAKQQPVQSLAYRTAGLLSGAASGAVIGFFYVGSWKDNQIGWAFGGLAMGSVLLGLLAALTYGPHRRADSHIHSHKGSLSSGNARLSAIRWWSGLAIALTSSICAYGLAYGLGAWAWNALTVGRFGLAVVLGLLSVLSLWCVRRSWILLSHFTPWPRL